MTNVVRLIQIAIVKSKLSKRTMKLLKTLPLATLIYLTSAWTPLSDGGVSGSRRLFLNQGAKLMPLVLVSSPAFAEGDSNEETAIPVTVIEEKVPEPSKVEEDDFIARLKAQSDANKEAYKKQAQRPDKLSNGQFSAQYDRPKYFGVQKTDGSYQMFLQPELDKLLADGKVRVFNQSDLSFSFPVVLTWSFDCCQK